MSKLYEHTTKVYQYMVENSETADSGEAFFKGRMTKAMKASGASSAWYSRIRDLLESPRHDPCITLFQRGNSEQDSIVRLNHPPPEAWENISAQGLTRRIQSATLDADHETRISDLEAWREPIREVNLSEVLLDLERRLKRLEEETGVNTNAP